MIKTHLYTFIIAVVITLASVHAYQFYQIKKQVDSNDILLKDVVSFLNQQLVASQNAIKTEK